MNYQGNPSERTSMYAGAKDAYTKLTGGTGSEEKEYDNKSEPAVSDAHETDYFEETSSDDDLAHNAHMKGKDNAVSGY